ncbi:polycystin-2-like isoform X2 [Sipha flava]|uniref:Polycystin-2-like isoform X2 n=1 Tax=Sipha flava TaxID=143950 RepID=A0A8B8FX94_9HEMI|nr:polycystin-2-like isoform X2 [Sipha flava]
MDDVENVRFSVVWCTRQIALDRNDRESYVKLTVRELIVYGVFLVIFVASFSGLHSYAAFVVNREVSSLFIDSSFTTSAEDADDADDVTIKFDGIITMEHFWKYFYNVLCDKLYETPLAGNENGSEILRENKFLFRPRARQVRVEEGHCEIRNQFKGLFRECYAPYEIRYEDKSSFGPKKGTQWSYSKDSETQGVYYEGEIAYYGAGGYYFDFPKNKADAKAFIQDLEYNTWLNRGTRAVFVDFAIYNCNINVLCAVKLVFEFPASGGIVPSYSFRTVKLYRYAVADTILSLVGMCTVVMFIVYFTLEEILEISYFRLRYFTKFWNDVDFGILLLGWCNFGLALVIALKERPSSKLEDTMSAPEEGYKVVEYLVARHELLGQLTAYMFFLVCIKVIKYTDLNKSMTIIYLSVGRCFKIVAGYLVIMAIVVTAFAVLGYCAFGAQVKGFSTVNDSLLSALRILMRDFDFRSLEHVDQSFTTFFFVLFTCMVIFVLLTMLVAIVFHAYFDVDVEELLAERKVYVFDKISEFVDHMLLRVGLKEWSTKRKNDRLKSELDQHITYQDIYKILKRCRYTDSQVEEILNKYGIRPQNAVHEDEARQMFRDVLQNQPGTSWSKE